MDNKIMRDRQLTDSLQESWKLMLEIEESFVYHLKDLSKAEQVILEATQLYWEVIEELEENKDWDGYNEFDDKFTRSYAFMTSNYFKEKVGIK